MNITYTPGFLVISKGTIGKIVQADGKFWFNPFVAGRRASKKSYPTPEACVPNWAKKLVQQDAEKKAKTDAAIQAMTPADDVVVPNVQKAALSAAQADAKLWVAVDLVAREKAGDDFDFSSIGTPPPLPTTYEQLRAICVEYASIGADAAVVHLKNNGQLKG